VLNLIGGWGDRPETARSCAERVQRSWQLMPPQPDAYGPWSLRQPDSPTTYALVAVDTADLDAIEESIVGVTERVNQGPSSKPGWHAEFARTGADERDEQTVSEYLYKVRAGFSNPRRPMNHVSFQCDSAEDPAVIRDYLTALVQAWEPARLAVTTYESLKAQGHRPPQVEVGWLTYIRGDIDLDTTVLDGQITITEGDGGRFLALAGTPDQPDPNHIMLVRKALGYPAG
jgi:hypothetical protein